MRNLRSLFLYLWRFKTTRQGKVIVAAIAVSEVVALASLEIPAYQLFFGLLALASVASVVGFLSRPVLEIAGPLPEKGIVGQPARAELTLTNRSQRTAYDLSLGYLALPACIEEPSADYALPALEPGESAAFPIVLHPRRRGLYSLPELRAYTTFPLNLVRAVARVTRGPTGPGGSLLALPDFHPVEDIEVPVSARYQPGGIVLSSHVGESPEYIGNREYRPGDSTRRLAHRAWARLAKPVVKEYQEEYYCRIALALDTYVPGRRRPGPEGFADLEAAVSLSAAVADALARGEYIIDIFAAGPKLYVFRAGRHTAHFENVLEILACVDACRTNPFDVVTPALADELSSISTVIVVLLDWDAAREDLVRTAVESGCAVKILIVRDGPTSQSYSHIDGVHAISQYSPVDVTRGGIDSL